MAEDRQSIRKPIRRLDENDKRRKEAMRRMLQAAAAIQADADQRDEVGSEEPGPSPQAGP